MDLQMIWIPYDANRWTVTRAVAAIVHSDEFKPRQNDEYAVDRPINFKVVLNESKAGGVGNDGTGILTLPTKTLGTRFLSWVKDTPLKIEGRKVKVFRVGYPRPHVSETLLKTPFVNPDIEEEHDKKLFDLQDSFRVDKIQVGMFYRPRYPSKQTEPLAPRSFSVEWEQDYVKKSTAWLSFSYDEKIIKIMLGNSMTEQYGSSIAINFSSIHKMALGYNPEPYICFDTLTPPVLEQLQFHRTMTGNKDVDFSKYRHRIGSLHPGHAAVAPYAHHLRVVLYNDPHTDIIKKFSEMCIIAGLASNMLIQCRGATNVEWDRCGFFETKRMWRLTQEFKQLPWAITFQFESLLRNGLLHTGDIESLFPRIKLVIEDEDKGPAYAGDLLRTFQEALQVRSPRESPMQCFNRIEGKFVYRTHKLSPGEFRCCHVTFTPTRMILEGPYAVQSNRVIRQFIGYEDYFLRVDFRDEDNLQYRWSKEVDGSTYLDERVGGTLKGGFELGGRFFQFLAYSMSALREHSVWFVNAFHHPTLGLVTAENIRGSLGKFEGTDLLRWPSKFAARLSQAFTATDPSVTIRRDEWERVLDLGVEPYLFTDGVGTISKALGNRIWQKLCEARRGDYSKVVQPSAYQIRFLGFKGVVCIDEQLDNHPDGISMRLRPSMEKFLVDAPEAEIEIAQSFEHPNTCYLNRPLIVVLEGLGIRTEAFVELQERAVAEARTIDDSSSNFRTKLDKHGLGRPYRFSWIISRLEELNLELKTLPGQGPGYDTPFIRQVRQISMLSILRDIKHNARIDVPESHLLVGVADEGPAYEAEGMTNVYSLPPGHIYACIQTSVDEPPMWLQGSCSISRSPVAHPGDVQRVRAIGAPPDDKLCFFRNLKNCVVLPSRGTRSLASCLGGGDVDGDLFAVICYEPLLPNVRSDPAEYPAEKPDPLDRDCTVDDICDFVVEYIKSDVLGLISDRLLVIADQSQDGIHDKDCLDLARLCSQAVDFPKQGVPVNIDDDRLPRTLIRCKPDWHAAEVVSPRKTDYYESSRALGVMFRQIKLDDADLEHLKSDYQIQPLTDPISERLMGRVQGHLLGFVPPRGGTPEILALFGRYVDELRYICATHTITNAPGVRLLESEIVAGTILAKCSQKRYRKDRMYRMRLHAGSIVKDVQRGFIEDMKNAPMDLLAEGLEKAWTAWAFSQEMGNAFGANSFGLIALAVVFECLDKLGGVYDDMSDDSDSHMDDDDDDGMDEY